MPRFVLISGLYVAALCDNFYFVAEDLNMESLSAVEKEFLQRYNFFIRLE